MNVLLLDTIRMGSGGRDVELETVEESSRGESLEGIEGCYMLETRMVGYRLG